MGDTLVLNKSVLQVDDNRVIEVLGYDRRNLWSRVNELCTADINYQFSEVESYSEYEVV